MKLIHMTAAVRDLAAWPRHYLNVRWRRQLRRAWLATPEADVLSEGTHGVNVDGLWARIDHELSVTSPRTQRSARRVFFPVTGLAAVAAAAGFFFFLGPHSNLPRSSERFGGLGDGIKGSGGVVVDGFRTLKFARLNADQSLEPGFDGMRVRRGQSIVFQIESPRHLGDRPSEIDVHYRDPIGKRQVLTEGYRVTRDRETLETPAGLVAFAPSQAGRYTFFLVERKTADDRSSREESADVGVSILVPDEP